MTDIALDTNVLVYATIPGAAQHRPCKRYVESILADDETRIVLSPLVCHEWIHIVSDERRFFPSVPVEEAVAVIRDWSTRPNVAVATIDAPSLAGALELVSRHRLGRKRLADALLAASLRVAGVRMLATCNVSDFAVFSFLHLINPLE